MIPYKNISQKSGVKAYAIEPEGIKVEFENDGTYLYTYKSAGKAAIEKMKKLAQSGKSLSTFISQKIKDKFAKKIE